MKHLSAVILASGLALVSGLPAYASLNSVPEGTTVARTAKADETKVATRILDCYMDRFNAVYHGQNWFLQFARASQFGAIEGAFVLGLCVGMDP